MDDTPLHQAVAWTTAVMDRIDPSSYDRRTPCDEWDVRALANHVVGGTWLFAGSFDPPSADEPPDDLVGTAPGSAYREAAAALLATFDEPGVDDRTGTLPPVGEVPGSVVRHIATMEALVHGWDLARATGQDTSTLPTAAAEAVDAGVRQGDGVEPLRPAMFGPPVQVPADASVIDRLLGHLGRRP